jgi:hypothetical protein
MARPQCDTPLVTRKLGYKKGREMEKVCPKFSTRKHYYKEGRKEGRKGNRDKRKDISYFLIYEKRDYIKQCSFSFGPTF